MRKKLQIIFLAILSFFLVGLQPSADISWQKLDEGLYLSEYDSPQKSTIGDNKITILKIDPKVYHLTLFSAKQKGEYTRTANQWAKDKKQIAVINAGMYQGDHATNVGYMKIREFVNNGRPNADNTIAAFGRKGETVPEFQIIDRTCQNWEDLKDKYDFFTQSIRMVDCNQRNKWSQQPKKWSMVVIGKDKEGNALFIFTRSPYSVHDFINILLKSPLNPYNLMYLEGGPEASFYLNHHETKIEKMGSYETGFFENDENTRYWKIPNVIGISKR